MASEVDPSLGGVDGAVPAARLKAGGIREAGDCVADQLTLTTAETADGIAHHEDLGEIVLAQRGAAKGLA